MKGSRVTPHNKRESALYHSNISYLKLYRDWRTDNITSIFFFFFFFPLTVFEKEECSFYSPVFEKVDK
jgi:hypothetical protein